MLLHACNATFFRLWCTKPHPHTNKVLLARLTHRTPPKETHLAGNTLGRIGRDREGQVLSAGDDGSVDTHDSRGRVHQRAARVARVERHVRLYDALNQPAVLAAHDASRHGRGEAQRVADGDDELADAELVRVAQCRIWQVRLRLEPHQRQIGRHVPADCRAADGSAVGQRHAHLARRADDVSVGQQVAIGRDDHTAALRAAGDALAWRETSELRRQRRSTTALPGARRKDLNRHSGRADRPHRVHNGTRVGVEGGGGQAVALPDK
eukprot:scaffold8366_cov121-Isochrysis_galbana.AAC.5